MNRDNSIRLLLTGACAAAMASPALAAQTVPEQQAAQAANRGAAAPNNAPQGESIIITAQKRAQVLVDVPQSVSVISGATLEKQHANDFADYLKLVPGLQLDQIQPGEGRLIIRGVNTGGVASTVGVYVDETPFGSSSGLVNGATLAADFDTFDVNRIEVLRGPQGTLYGASSLSGVLKFVTNLPSTHAFLVRGRAGVEAVKGGDLGYSGNLVVNVPLSSTLAFRASGSYRKDGGFIDSIGTEGAPIFGIGVGPSDVQKNINGDKLFGGRASLLFTPTNNASLRLTAIAQNINVDAPTLVEADPATLHPLYGDLTQSQYVPQFSDFKYRLYNATGTVGLGFADLTSSTSFGKLNQHFRSDLTQALVAFLRLPPGFGGLGLPAHELYELQDTNNRKFSQELRLSSQNRFVDWLVGGYYTHEKGLIAQDFTAVSPGTLTPIDLTPFLGPLVLGHATLDSSYRELAGFADATVHLTDHFDVDLGGRYSHNKQTAHQIGAGALAGSGDLGVDRSSESVFTYSVAPKYKIDPNMSVYARVAKGFRPGGPNVVPPNPPLGFRTSYGSDSILSFEAGLKKQSADHRFSLDASVFHIHWNDIQLIANINGFGFNTNGGTATSDGFEITGTARLARGFEVSANAAYTDAHLTEDTPPDVGGLSGDALPFSPKLTFALNGDYSWTLSSGVTAHAGASVRHVSDQSGSFDPDYTAATGSRAQIRSYSVIDMMAGVNFGRFSLDAYVKNLGNSHGIISTPPYLAFHAFPFYPNGAQGTGIIRPRTIGLTLTASN